MFERFVKRASALERYRTGPYAKERERFMAHLLEEGRSDNRLQTVNRYLLAIASCLDLADNRLVTVDELVRVAEQWSRCRCKRTSSSKSVNVARIDFLFVASSWLRFLGRLAECKKPEAFADYLQQFLEHLRNERGFSDYTLGNRERSLRPFLTWWDERGSALSSIGPADVDSYLSHCASHGWARTTISFHVQSLRCFFRYAGSRQWCADLSGVIQAPRLYTHERLPQGPNWQDVQRLIANDAGDSSLQIRNRAIILLVAVYGFRAGEVCRLRLADLDWEKERIALRRPKQRKVQEYPLTQVAGEAILRYLREVRPRCMHRELFLSLRQPYRPLSVGGLSTMIRGRMQKLGIKAPHYGAHALRHSCATHLLAAGFSLKQIGDHLGHVSAAATCIYAKVDLSALRQVADLNIADLIQYVEECHRTETPLIPRGDLAGLREVAQLAIGGLL